MTEVKPVYVFAPAKVVLPATVTAPPVPPMAPPMLLPVLSVRRLLFAKLTVPPAPLSSRTRPWLLLSVSTPPATVTVGLLVLPVRAALAERFNEPLTVIAELAIADAPARFKVAPAETVVA